MRNNDIFSSSGKSAVSLLLTTVLLLLCWAGAVSAEPLIDQSRAKIDAATYLGTFSFIVTGDTCGDYPYLLSPEYKSIIEYANQAKVNMMMLTGDMIRGGNVATVQRQWDEFFAVSSTSTAAILPVPGDQDIWDSTSAAIWRQRFGARWYSFDYSGCHFIFLDTQDTETGLSQEQVKWLYNDLEAARGTQAIYIFMHRPLFMGSGWMSGIHQRLRNFPVKAVFASHYPRYQTLGDVDGISYYIVGGGGVTPDVQPELGGFHHFIQVVVRSSEIVTTVREADGTPLPEEMTRRWTGTQFPMCES